MATNWVKLCIKGPQPSEKFESTNKYLVLEFIYGVV